MNERQVFILNTLYSKIQNYLINLFLFYQFMNNSPQSATQPQIQNTVEENQTSTNAATEQQPKQIQRQPPAKPPQRKPYRRKRSTDPPDPNQPKIATLFKPIEKESKVIKK